METNILRKWLRRKPKTQIKQFEHVHDSLPNLTSAHNQSRFLKISNATFGVIGGAALSMLIFGWWGVFVVVFFALAVYAECKTGK